MFWTIVAALLAAHVILFVVVRGGGALGGFLLDVRDRLFGGTAEQGHALFLANQRKKEREKELEREREEMICRWRARGKAVRNVILG